MADRPTTNADLSRMLFEARELIEMWADVVEARAGKPDDWSRRVLREIDAYRAERGWSPYGFGGENDRDGYRLEFEFWEGDHDRAITQLSKAHDALVAMNVLKRSPTQLGFRAPWPEEVDESSAIVNEGLRRLEEWRSLPLDERRSLIENLMKEA